MMVKITEQLFPTEQLIEEIKQSYVAVLERSRYLFFTLLLGLVDRNSITTRNLRKCSQRT
jgi:hypothetical protein